MTKDEIMRLADILADRYHAMRMRYDEESSYDFEAARAAIEAALTEKHEPDCWMYQYTRPDGTTYLSTVLHDRYPHKEVAVYTHPAPVNQQLLEKLKGAAHYIDKLGGVSQPYRQAIAQAEKEMK